ncbi:MerR family transcriptional regulator [Amycolatopsis albispora]|uniref:MerR family transcriptional regulator n=1 Tax=Amycolatopsis albispora TaxID=1804986 RepID=A0A344KZN8_9PSEU|nr:MerR family transcriptional regulator [Amycolatopsis albispora]AXB41262.1 MerR family transcriptional regulator [Amycolatopsis albispora]
MHYTISEVARHFGLAVSALRYYDEIGLLAPAGRRGTVRTYGRGELRRLALVQLLHHDGLMSLADTATALSADQAGPRTVIEDAIGVMREQVERLQAAQRVLEHLLTCPRDDPVRDCPVLAEQLEQTVEHALAGASGPLPGAGKPAGR